MGTELDGRLLALRQALAISIALATRSNPEATSMALELLGDLKESIDNAPADTPFETPAWVSGAHAELDSISQLVRAFTQQPLGSEGTE